jgi:hypothetical protein
MAGSVLYCTRVTLVTLLCLRGLFLIIGRFLSFGIQKQSDLFPFPLMLLVFRVNILTMMEKQNTDVNVAQECSIVPLLGYYGLRL